MYKLNKMVQALTPLTCIRVVPISNLGRDTDHIGYSDSGPFVFFLNLYGQVLELYYLY
jgi:hypothetical protein